MTLPSRFKVRSYLPWTVEHRLYRETVEFVAGTVELMRASWGEEFPDPPTIVRDPRMLVAIADACRGLIYTTKAKEEGKSKEDVLAIFDEHIRL